MRTVGLRELKDRFSEYIRQVRSGQAVIVTNRGQVVASSVLTPVEVDRVLIRAQTIGGIKEGEVIGTAVLTVGASEREKKETLEGSGLRVGLLARLRR